MVASRFWSLQGSEFIVTPPTTGGTTDGGRGGGKGGQGGWGKGGKGSIELTVDMMETIVVYGLAPSLAQVRAMEVLIVHNAP